MKYTDKLCLPIWNKPETDVFDIEQFNEGMQTIDDTIIHILNQINDLAIGDTKIDLNGYVKEEAFKEKIKNIQVKLNNDIKTDNSQLDTIDSKKLNKGEPNSISLDMLTTEAKASMTGNKVAVVGGNSVSMAQFSSSIQNDIGEYVKQSLELNTGFYVKNTASTKLVFVEHANYQNVFVPVTEGERYKINVGVSGDNFILICFVDNSVDKNIIKIEILNETGLKRYKDYVVIVPNGAGSMLIQGQDAIEAKIVNKLSYLPIATKKEVEKAGNENIKTNKKLFDKITTEKTINLYNMYDQSQTDYTRRITAKTGLSDIMYWDNTTAFFGQMCVLKIPVKENTTYTRSHGYNSNPDLAGCLISACVNSNGTVLKVIDSNRDNSNDGNITFTTPKGTEYVLMGLYKNNIPSFMFVEGEIISNYIKFENKINENIKHKAIYRYWEDLIGDKSIEILKNNKGNEINLAFVSDCHVQSSETEVGVGKILEELDKNISFDNILFGGDMLMATYTNVEDVYQDIMTYKNVFYPIKDKLITAQGNHETYYTLNDEYVAIDENKSYGILRGNMQKGCIKSNYSKLSYYYDDVEKKIRYIILDWRNCSQEIIDFVFTTLKDIDNKSDCDEWCVLFMMHYPFIDNDYLHLFKGLKAIKDKTSYNYNYVSINSDGENNYNFNNRINIVGVLSGHTHKDWVGTQFNFDGQDVGINFFITCADAIVDRGDSLATKTSYNSIYNHAINCITINKEERIVTIYRLGGYGCRDGYSWNGVSNRTFTY